MLSVGRSLRARCGTVTERCMGNKGISLLISWALLAQIIQWVQAGIYVSALR